MQLPGRSNKISEAKKEEITLYAREFQSLNESDSARLNRLAMTDREFESPRGVDIFGQVADFTDYGSKRVVNVPSRHNIPVPLNTALTIKHSHRLFGDLPDTYVDRREESPQERYRSDTMEKIAWAIIRASGEETTFKDAAWDGSKYGASVFEWYYDREQELPIFTTVSPREILIVPGGRNPHDFQRMYRWWKVSLETLMADYKGMTYDGVPVPELLKDCGASKVIVVEMKDKERCVRFVLDSEFGTEGKRIPIYEKEHGLGCVPAVVIPNIGPYREVWGWGDYELVRGLVHYIPALFSREADIIRAVAGGAYTEDGTGQSPAKLLDVIRKGGVAPVKRGSTVKPIDTPQAPDFLPAHADRAMEFLRMVGFAPPAAWGDAGATSGSDRGLQLQPLLELTAMKQSNWSQGLQRLFYIGFKMLEKQSGPGDNTYYHGEVRKGPRRKAFILGPFGDGVKPMQANPNTLQPEAVPALGAEMDPTMELLELPRSPKELFQGDYTIRFEWNNQIDPDDPAQIASLLNEFAQGTMSLRTYLERRGYNNPEDEIKLIQQEAEQFPWIRDGVLKMLQMQFDADQSGQGGGNMSQAPGIGGAAQSMAGGNTRATDADMLGGALPGGGTGTPYGAA